MSSRTVEGLGASDAIGATITSSQLNAFHNEFRNGRVIFTQPSPRVAWLGKNYFSEYVPWRVSFWK